MLNFTIFVCGGFFFNDIFPGIFRHHVRSFSTIKTKTTIIFIVFHEIEFFALRKIIFHRRPLTAKATIRKFNGESNQKIVSKIQTTKEIIFGWQAKQQQERKQSKEKIDISFSELILFLGFSSLISFITFCSLCFDFNSLTDFCHFSFSISFQVKINNKRRKLVTCACVNISWMKSLEIIQNQRRDRYINRDRKGVRMTTTTPMKANFVDKAMKFS